MKKIDYRDYIKTIPNYPKEGIMFRDVTPLMQNASVFASITEELSDFAKEIGAEVIVGPESRGFIFGCPVALQAGLGFVPVRKPNKLPREQVSTTYALEYGTDTLCMHKDGITKGQKVLIIDDLLATGGTINACIDLVNQLGGEVVGAAFVIELVDLKGREKLGAIPVKALCAYEGE